MTKQTTQIKRFTDLKTWQTSRELTKLIYKTTADFPASELYGLTSQMKRASISVASNIAEGFRRDTMKDKIHFYVMAHGSLTELQNQLILGHDLSFMSSVDFRALMNLSVEADKLLSGLIKASKARL
jgi:four helix bundle protein